MDDGKSLHDQVAKPKPKAEKAGKGSEVPKEPEKPAADPALEDDAHDAVPQDEVPEDFKVWHSVHSLIVSQETCLCFSNSSLI